MENKERIDLYLVKNNYCETRSQAQEMINFGLVKVNGKVLTKQNTLVSDNDKIETISLKYVSRAGLKLEKALETFKINLENKVILDIGASTGGFTDCCLQNKAKLVYALDVGTNQLHEKFLNNNSVVNLEKTNLKDIPSINFENKIDVIVCDVSFISLKHVFDALTNLYSDELIMIFLIKPEFELSKNIISKTKGLITNPKHHLEAINNVKQYAKSHNINLIEYTESPITGRKKGNIEFIGLFKWKK